MSTSFPAWIPTLAALDSRFPAATEARTFAQRIADIAINVKDFAKGDGSTIDTAAIMAAWNWNSPLLTAASDSAPGATTITFVEAIPTWVTTPSDGKWHIVNVTRPGSTTIAPITGITYGTKTVTVGSTVIKGEGIKAGDSIRLSASVRGNIYFPPGIYMVDAPIYLDGGARSSAASHGMSARLYGSTGFTSQIWASGSGFVGYVLDRAPTWRGVTGGPIEISDLYVRNPYSSATGGGGIRLSNTLNGVVRNCTVQANKAIICHQGGTLVEIQGGNSSISNGGAGHAVGDVVTMGTITGGTVIRAITVYVTAVSGGVVTAASVIDPGQATGNIDIVAVSQTATTGSGTGLTLSGQFTGGTQTAIIDNCHAVYVAPRLGSVGCSVGEDAQIRGFDASGFESAVCMHGPGGSLEVYRLEVNIDAVKLGVNEVGTTRAASDFRIGAGSMESNANDVNFAGGTGAGQVGPFGSIGSGHPPYTAPAAGIGSGTITGYDSTTGAQTFLGTGSLAAELLTITAVTSGTLGAGNFITSSVSNIVGVKTALTYTGTGVGGTGTYGLVQIPETVLKAVGAQCHEVVVVGVSGGGARSRAVFDVGDTSSGSAQVVFIGCNALNVGIVDKLNQLIGVQGKTWNCPTMERGVDFIGCKPTPLIAPKMRTYRTDFEPGWAITDADQARLWSSIAGGGAGAEIATTVAAATEVTGAVTLKTSSAYTGNVATDGVMFCGKQLVFKGSKYPILEARFKLDNWTNVKFFLGFTDDPTVIEMPIFGNAGNINSDASNACGIFYDTNLTTDKLSVGGVKADTDTALLQQPDAIPFNNTYVHFRVMIESETVKGFRDGKMIQGLSGASVGVASAVTSTTALVPYLVLAPNAGAQRIITLDYFNADQERNT